MKQFIALLRLELSGILSEMTNSGKKQKGKVGRGILFALLILILAGSMVLFEVRIMDVLAALNAQDVLLKLLVFASMLMTFVYGFLQVLSRLYFSKDISLLAYLPARDVTIYSAKLTGHLLYETAISALFILPGTFVYMSRMGFDAGLLLRAAVITVLSPVLPVCLCALISGLLTLIPGFWKHRETVTTVFTLILVISVTLISYFSGQAGGMMATNDESMQKMILDLSGTADRLVGRIAPIAWGASALTGDGVSLLLLLVASIASFALATGLFGRNYIASASGGSESGTDFKKVDLATLQIRDNSPLKALTQREIREMLRTPAYLVNGLLGPVIMPTLLTVLLLVPFMNASEGGIAQTLSQFEQNGVHLFMITVFLTCMSSMMAGMNSVASTAVSREGKRHGMMMSLPVPAGTLVRSKFLASLLFAMVGILPPPLICAVLIPGFAPYAVLMLLWSAMMAYSGSASGLAIDLGKPRLDWINENQAIKQNMNQIIGLLLFFVVLGAAGVLGVVLSTHLSGEPLMILAETLFLAAVCALFRFWLSRASRKYPLLEG